MAVSDELTKLATRAKEAKERAAAAQGKTKADLGRDVETARISAQEQAEKLRKSADARKDKISVWWHNMQRSWDEHLAKIRDDVDHRKAEHNVDRAERRADRAADDAMFAIDFASAAITEAEYAVLDADLARMEADELTTSPVGART